MIADDFREFPARNVHLQSGFDPGGIEVLPKDSILPGTSRSQRSRPTVHEIRKEKRSPENLQILLPRMTEPLLTEAASTDNVSSHGMRVRTYRPWKRDTHLIVQSSENELWGCAKVVYCQTLPANTFALGLEFVARTGGRIRVGESEELNKLVLDKIQRLEGVRERNTHLAVD